MLTTAFGFFGFLAAPAGAPPPPTTTAAARKQAAAARAARDTVMDGWSIPSEYESILGTRVRGHPLA